MKTVCLNILVMLLSIASLTACHDEPQFADTPTGNFEALWSALDRHYCFFQYKNVDWQEVHDRYAAKISNSMTSEELFRVCSEMLKELKDGHTNLSSSFDTSRYWIWEQFPQNYDERLVEEHYLRLPPHKRNLIPHPRQQLCLYALPVVLLQHRRRQP